jgi:hypothetical protein
MVNCQLPELSKACMQPGIVHDNVKMPLFCCSKRRRMLLGYPKQRTEERDQGNAGEELRSNFSSKLGVTQLQIERRWQPAGHRGCLSSFLKRDRKVLKLLGREDLDVERKEELDAKLQTAQCAFIYTTDRSKALLWPAMVLECFHGDQCTSQDQTVHCAEGEWDHLIDDA